MSTQMSKPPKHPNVPFVDLGAQYRTIATEVNQAISKVIEQTDFILGREVHLFERSEEHTSELQSHSDLVCRLLLEKKKREVRGHGRWRRGDRRLEVHCHRKEVE